MANSKHRPKFKAKKKVSNFNKQKKKEMENQKVLAQNDAPIDFTYHKDKKTVEVPINAWRMLNQAARDLEPLAAFVAVMHQIEDQHRGDGTLIPIFKEDLEIVPGQTGPKGEVQYKLKDSFWNKGQQLIQIEKPTIVMADGKTIYDASKNATADEPPSGQDAPVTELVT